MSSVPKAALQYESKIVWLRDINKIPYVRERITDFNEKTGISRSRKLELNIEMELVGYAELESHAPFKFIDEGKEYFYRRVFFLKKADRANDPEGVYKTGCPIEAVDPKSVFPKEKGEVNDKVRGKQSSVTLSNQLAPPQPLTTNNLTNSDLNEDNLDRTILSEAENFGNSKISNTDWTNLARSLQADFIKRLKSNHLLHCITEGLHSELTIISGESLKQIRNFCWRMAEKYKQNSSVHRVFINNLKGKLGEEVIKARLADLVTEVDYEARIGGDGKVDFRLAADSTVGIQVKARHDSIDKVKWMISKEEAEQNAVLVCILIQEEVHEAQTEYNLILAGFLPTNMIEGSNGKASVGIDELLYGGALQSYLESFDSH